MADIHQIIRQVNSSMAMEGMPLTAEDRERIQKVLRSPGTLDAVIGELVKKRTVPLTANK